MTEVTTRADRFARWFASPASVLVILPMLVIGVGLVVLLLGRKATHDSAEAMARRQLVAQAAQVQHDVGVTLDQADPVLAGMHQLATASLPTPDAMQRLYDLVHGRPGIANASLAFPSGDVWTAYYDGQTTEQTGELRIGEGHMTAAGTERTNWAFAGGIHVFNHEHNDYDARTRPHYTVAVEAKHRVWMPPHAFSTSHKTGITVTEPIYADAGAGSDAGSDAATLVAVATIDYNVDGLSAAIGEAPLDGARTIVFTADGTVLAYPSVRIPDAAIKDRRLLRFADFKDPALDALLAALGTAREGEQQFLRIQASDGDYLASVAPVGGTHGGASAPIDWRLATLVPEHVLFGATQRFGRDALVASGAALMIALGVAVIFAWNLLRMRRHVAAARAEAKVHKDRADELGSYRLVERLGVGGMGEVWRAEHRLLARHAAIKLVRRDTMENPAHAALVLERFRREAQTLATLRSRNTIELYDYGVTDDGSFFFVMELLEGVDFSQLVRGHGPQPAGRVVHLLIQACQSLAEAHDAGLLHRDIKPANLFVCRAADEVDIVKLLDFGIAHNLADPARAVGIPPLAGGAAGTGVAAAAAAPAVPTGAPALGATDRLTMDGSVVGTPGYIPPEQATGADLDARGDLYALGCVAWWLLAGAEVYTDATSGDDLIRKHAFDAVPELRAAVRGWLPAELERIVMQCLAKRPSDRPADARALADALSAIDIPPEHAWTKVKAVAWWRSLGRAQQTAAPDAATAVGAKLTRAADTRGPDAATRGPDAATPRAPAQMVTGMAPPIPTDALEQLVSTAPQRPSRR